MGEDAGDSGPIAVFSEDANGGERHVSQPGDEGLLVSLAGLLFKVHGVDEDARVEAHDAVDEAHVGGLITGAVGVICPPGEGLAWWLVLVVMRAAVKRMRLGDWVTGKDY